MHTRVRFRTLAAVVVLAALGAGCGSGGANGGGSTARSSSTTAPAQGECPAAAARARGVAYESVSGVEPDLLSADVYSPARTGPCAPAPVVIWVHGGGWRVGGKGNQIADKAKLFNDAGYVLVSVNYRLSDPAAGGARVVYPTHNTDVAAAVAWVHDHVAGYGGDPQRLALLGHSAGAGIVAAVATDERYLGAHDLGLDAIRCAAPLDTEGFDVAASAAAPGQQGRMYQNAFGDTPERWVNASPMNHVVAGKAIPSMLLVRRGTPARQAGLDAFGAKLRAAGVDVTIVDAQTLTHAQVNRQIGAAGDTVMTPAVTSFLEGCFAA